MEFRGSIIIKKPINLVTELFAASNSLKEYQDGFVRKELQSGREGEVGATSRMYYKYGDQDMILKETIVSNNLPHSFEAFYQHQHMDNTMKCRFIALGESATKYEYEIKYTRIDWIMPKLIAILFPGMYRKQGAKWMEQFKDFVEKQ